MLPLKPFIRTNFVDGIKFNPEQIGLSNDYFLQKTALSNIYGIGKGVLVGFKNSLLVISRDNMLILQSGACIDEDGNIIFVDKEHIISKDISILKFENRSDVYIYIFHESEMIDLKPSKDDKNIKIYYTISEKFKILISEKRVRNQKVIELARISINHKISETIKPSKNPFDVGDNEIDITNVEKIVGQNMGISLSERERASGILEKYASFLHEFGFRKSIISLSSISSVAFNLSIQLKTQNIITPWQLYDMLLSLLNISLKVEIERDDIIHTAFWKNIVRMQNIFSFRENLKIDYYQANLNIETSFFSKVLLHFNNATIFDGNWDDILKEKKVQVVKRDYIIVGSDSICDMIVEGEDIAQQHAKIYQYENGFFIEDMPDTSGIYVNAMRLEKGMKKFIRKQDYVALGKNGRVLNLQNIQF